MARYSDTLRDQNGNEIAGAFVTVLDYDGALATVTNDDRTAAQNPFLTGSDGGFVINAPVGFYTLEYRYGGRLIFRDRNVIIGVPPIPSPDPAGAAQASAAIALTASTAAQGFSAISTDQATQAKTAANQAGSAATGAVALGTYPYSARASVPRGVTGTTSLVGGSGGASGTFALGITGGGGTGAAGFFVVVGGVVTNVTVTTAGYGYTSAPALSFAASPGLTGASAIAVIGYLCNFYWAYSNDGLSIALYQNVGGVPTAVPSVDPLYSKSYLDSAVAAVTNGRETVWLQYVSGPYYSMVTKPVSPTAVLSGDGTQYRFRMVMPFDTGTGGTALSVTQYNGSAFLPTISLSIDGTGVAIALKSANLIDFARDTSGATQLRVLPPSDFATPALTRLMEEVNLTGKSPSPDRPLGFGMVDRNMYLVKIRPDASSYSGTMEAGPSQSDEVRATIYNMGDFNNVPGGLPAFNSFMSRFNGGSFEEHFNLQFSEIDGGFSTDTGLLPSTIESVVFGGSLSDTANSALFPASGIGHGHVTNTSWTAVVVRNDATTGGVDLPINVRNLTVADHFVYGTRLIVTTTVYNQTRNNEIWAKGTYKVTYEGAVGRQVKVETSFDCTDPAVTIVPATSYDIMIGAPLRDVNRCVGYINGVKQATQTIDKRDGSSTLLGIAEKVVFWHARDPRRQIVITNLAGPGKSHWEDSGSGPVNINALGGVYVANFAFGSKFYAGQAYNSPAGVSKNMTGIKFGASYTFEVTDADPL